MDGATTNTPERPWSVHFGSGRQSNKVRVHLRKENRDMHKLRIYINEVNEELTRVEVYGGVGYAMGRIYLDPRKTDLFQATVRKVLVYDSAENKKVIRSGYGWVLDTYGTFKLWFEFDLEDFIANIMLALAEYLESEEKTFRKVVEVAGRNYSESE